MDQNRSNGRPRDGDGRGSQRARTAAAQGGTFDERGPVRLRYEEAGSGFPLLAIAGGGLSSAARISPRTWSSVISPGCTARMRISCSP